MHAHTPPNVSEVMMIVPHLTDSPFLLDAKNKEPSSEKRLYDMLAFVSHKKRLWTFCERYIAAATVIQKCSNNL
jgi:hypothetical protein